VELIPKNFNGNEVLRGWFDSSKPPLSIFEKKPKVKVIPEEVTEMVDGWIKEGEAQREKRLNLEDATTDLVYTAGSS
jgi:hypothetical protein